MTDVLHLGHALPALPPVGNENERCHFQPQGRAEDKRSVRQAGCDCFPKSLKTKC